MCSYVSVVLRTSRKFPILMLGDYTLPCCYKVALYIRVFITNWKTKGFLKNLNIFESWESIRKIQLPWN